MTYKVMPSIFCLQDILNWFQFQYRDLLAWTLIRPHLAGTELLTWTIDSCERFKLATVRFCFLNKHLNWRNRWARKGPHSNNWVCHYCFLWGCSVSRIIYAFCSMRKLCSWWLFWHCALVWRTWKRGFLASSLQSWCSCANFPLN